MKYRARFSESGGYDCLSDAIVIEEGRQNPACSNIVATIDLADFGQPPSGPCPLRGQELAELFAAAIVNALNASSFLSTGAPLSDFLDSLKKRR